MKFVSRYLEPRFVVRPTRRMLVEGMLHLQPGKTIEFKGHEYETEDKEEIDFLQKHIEFGKTFDIKKEAKEIKAEIKEMAKMLEKEEKNLVCPECGFEAASEVGLKVHMKKHQ